MFVIQVTFQDGSDSWYLHAKGERIKSPDSAVQYTCSDAEVIAKMVRDMGYNAKIESAPTV